MEPEAYNEENSAAVISGDGSGGTAVVEGEIEPPLTHVDVIAATEASHDPDALTQAVATSINETAPADEMTQRIELLHKKVDFLMNEVSKSFHERLSAIEEKYPEMKSAIDAMRNHFGPGRIPGL